MGGSHEISEAELAALADGSLAPERREALERRVEASPTLARALADQRAALAAVRSVADEPAPEALRASVAAQAQDASAALRRGRPGGWRRVLTRWRLGRAGRLGARSWALPLAGAVVVAAVALVLALGQGRGGSAPTVAEAARVALASARVAPPGEAAHGGELAASVEGVAYPYWAADTGWRAVGARRDVLHGRTVRTVFYANDRGQRIGYAIAAGDALPVHGGRTVVRHGVRVRLLGSGGTAVVTWLRDGHTCILAGRGVDPSTLVRLASWRSSA